MTILSKKKEIEGSPKVGVAKVSLVGVPELKDKGSGSRKRSSSPTKQLSKIPRTSSPLPPLSSPPHSPQQSSSSRGAVGDAAPAPPHQHQHQRQQQQHHQEAQQEQLPIPSSPRCNSEDEYDCQENSLVSEEEWIERERRFSKDMKKRGLIIKKMGDDGACLFRAVADQLYGDQEMHGIVRKHCMDYVAANAEYYSQYVTEDVEDYVARKRGEGVHGNHIELQALGEMYNRTVEVYCYAAEPITIFHGAGGGNEPIRLSYHRGVHYNSVVDPYSKPKPPIGASLPIPPLPLALAPFSDRAAIEKAIRASEDSLIEQTMLEDKLRATDWEATNEELEEQVSKESYLQWLKDNERRSRNSQSQSTHSTATTSRKYSPPPQIPGPSGSSGSRSPVSATNLSSNFNLPPTSDKL